MSVHDLQHKLQPHFPEVSVDGEWERREYLYRNAARTAVLLIADSSIGREDLLNCYGDQGLDAERVRVLPFLPPPYVERRVTGQDLANARRKYKLPKEYIFYPAQFWPHKNHERILKALARLNEQRVPVPIVLSGSSSGALRERTFQRAMSVAREADIQERVHYLGYVPDRDMAALYSAATALVMPTFFGPTNIPIIEAWACDCPVVTSDLRGIREQVEDAALLVDPTSVEEIATAIERVVSDDELRRNLAEAGRKRLRSYTPDDYRERLGTIVDEAKALISSRSD
jgi:glycosyltransferase involved in cell wall biosynthesis